eukprot:7389137-Prymnesium_polylepis.2
MINSILPNADVHGFLCVTDAMDYMTANVESNRVDLVLLDLLMPCQSEQDVGEGGMRVAELLVQQERTLKPTFSARPLTVLVSSSASEKPWTQTAATDSVTRWSKNPSPRQFCL